MRVERASERVREKIGDERDGTHLLVCVSEWVRVREWEGGGGGRFTVEDRKRVGKREGERGEIERGERRG